MILPKGIRISSGYGERTNPVTGTRSFHNGIDIVMPVGTRILAPYRGLVDKIWEDRIGGLQMRFSFSLNKDRYIFGFAHLSRVVAIEGKYYDEGDLIAYSGNSGVSTGPHLHLTVRINGKLVNPIDVYNKLNIKPC